MEMACPHGYINYPCPKCTPALLASFMVGSGKPPRPNDAPAVGTSAPSVTEPSGEPRAATGQSSRCDWCGSDGPTVKPRPRGMMCAACATGPHLHVAAERCPQFDACREWERYGDLQHRALLVCKEQRDGAWAQIKKLEAMLRTVRGMIAEDTTFPGAVLRVEIDRLLGNAAQPPSSAIPDKEKGQ